MSGKQQECDYTLQTNPVYCGMYWKGSWTVRDEYVAVVAVQEQGVDLMDGDDKGRQSMWKWLTV